MMVDNDDDEDDDGDDDDNAKNCLMSNFIFFAEIAILCNRCKGWPLPYRLTEHSWILAEVRSNTCFLGFHIFGFNWLLLEKLNSDFLQG